MHAANRHFTGIRFYMPVLLLVLTFAGCDQGPETEPLPEAPNERMAFALTAALGNCDYNY